MALPWVRLDTQVASNPKILELIEEKKHRAAFAWVCSLGYCGAHGTDGFIPKSALPFLHANHHDAAALVAVNLWESVPGGYSINGWAEFQVSSDEASERRKRAQLAAMKRWHGNA